MGAGTVGNRDADVLLSLGIPVSLCKYSAGKQDIKTEEVKTLLERYKDSSTGDIPIYAARGSDLEEDVAVNIGDEADDDDQFIDIGDIGLEGEEEVEEEEPEDEDMTTMTTGMNGDDHDETGRNAALATFKQIQGNIVDDFEQLAADEDRELYHDYLKTNILLWRDKFEDSLSQGMAEPTTPEYEAEASGAEGGGGLDAGLGGEEEEEFDLGGL